MTNNVYKCINSVQADLAKIGISKDEKNQVQNYKFRGIDSIFNTLAPLLAKHGLCILPKVLKREVTERATSRGGILFYVTVEVEFSFVCAEDGSTHIVVICGEAMDSGDKATNKAMSAAYKYAALQAFCIPTEGDNDADAGSPEVINLLTASQIIALKNKIIESKTEVAKICEAFKVESIESLSLKDFDTVMNRLNATIKKNQDKETNNG